MPRRHPEDRGRGRLPKWPVRPITDAPEWAHAAGYEVRATSAEKTYRCPGCDHEIRPRLTHLVVVPTDEPGARRHWHTECWRQELRRARGSGER